jgi:hypothetical protein
MFGLWKSQGIFQWLPDKRTGKSTCQASAMNQVHTVVWRPAGHHRQAGFNGQAFPAVSQMIGGYIPDK